MDARALGLALGLCARALCAPALSALALGLCALALCALALSACQTVPQTPRVAPEGAPPALVVGTFEDDYGHRFTIGPALWHQHPSMRFHVARWNTAGRWLVARNDAANAADGGRWTRIDWVALPPAMAPYTWAFCLSAYDAPTRAAAETTRVARPETPRTGCNGHPFSRMKRAAP